MLPPASAIRPDSSLFASLFVESGLCSLGLAGNNSAEAALHQMLRILSQDVSSLFTLRLSVQFFSNYLVVSSRLTAA